MDIEVVHHEMNMKTGEHKERKLEGKELEKWISEHIKRVEKNDNTEL